MVSGVLFVVFLYLLYSRLADAPPPAHQTNKAAAVERPAKAAAGTAGEFFFSFDCCVFFICLTHTSLPISQTTVSRGVSIRRDSAEEVEWPARAAASAAG